MIYVLLGPDDFLKKQYINSLAKENGADLAVFGKEDVLPQAGHFLETDLFSRPKVFVLSQMPELSGSLEKVISSPNILAIAAETLDKRKKETKELLAHKNITVKEFLLPHGRELDQWIIGRITALGGKISAEAAAELARRLGRDEAKETKFGGKVVSVEEVYSLFGAENEIQKLLAFANGREISKTDVSDLVSESGETDALQITNALAEKNKELSFNLIGRFLKEQSAGDEKSGLIQLNALLSEQFRNVAMVQDFLARKISEPEILDQTGWKSGRLFIMKKIAGRFSHAKILELLNKLSALDEEMKTSQTPPRVLLDLILAQVF